MYFSMMVNGVIMRSRTIKTMSTIERTTMLSKITVSGRTETYSAFISSHTLASFKLSELAFVTVTYKVARSQFVKFAEAMKASLVKLNAGETTLGIVLYQWPGST